jgi:hypothetical protein
MFEISKLQLNGVDCGVMVVAEVTNSPVLDKS